MDYVLENHLFKRLGSLQMSHVSGGPACFPDFTGAQFKLMVVKEQKL